MRTPKLSARLVVALAFVLVQPAISSDRAVEAARDYRAAHGAEILSSFAEFLAIPNVASDLPNIERNALHIQAELEARGAHVELWRQEGVPPIVYGELAAPGAERHAGHLHALRRPARRARRVDPGPLAADALRRRPRGRRQAAPLPRRRRGDRPGVADLRPRRGRRQGAAAGHSRGPRRARGCRDRAAP